MAFRLTSIAITRITARQMLQNTLVALLTLALQANIAAAQELDSAGQQQKIEKQGTPAQSQGQQKPDAIPLGSQTQAPPLASGAPLVVPAGTKLQLGLLHPLSVKNSKPGDSVYLQITFPVTASNQMVIPPGTYVQGIIDKITRRDRSRATLEFDMRSVSLIYSTGYTVSLAGPLTASPTTADLRTPDLRNPNDIPAATMGATGTTTAPTLSAPSLGNGPRNAMIALGVAGAAGTALLFVAANRSDVEMPVGTPFQTILAAPLELDRERVTAAVQQYSVQVASAPPQVVKAPEKPKMCYDPGTPGTPDTVIPGSPGTPPTVIPGVNGAQSTVIPGTPATPPTVIPGTPGTPGREYPCPK
jgi:hypothetical protein